MRYVVQMWFKYTGNNFHVTGTKTDLELLRWDLRKQFRQIPRLFNKWTHALTGGHSAWEAGAGSLGIGLINNLYMENFKIVNED